MTYEVFEFDALMIDHTSLSGGVAGSLEVASLSLKRRGSVANVSVIMHQQ